MKNISIEKNLFLCDYVAIKEFSKLFINDQSINQEYIVICERKEDIIVIRNQLYYEIEKLSGQNLAALSGISMFTLDALAQSFCASLASSHKKLTYTKRFQKVFLDIPTQEKLVELILFLFNYRSSDALALAKQILILIDTPLPSDTNFIELLLATQNKETVKSVQEIDEIALKQILATYHLAKKELSNYMRLQELVSDYLQGPIFDDLKEFKLGEELVLPKKILNGTILWFAAPEHSLHNKLEKTFKPGNFQSFLVDDFKQSIQNIRKICHPEKAPPWFESKTILNVNINTELSNKNINFTYFANDQSFFQTIKQVYEDKKNFLLLGDFSGDYFRTTQKNADGRYKLTVQDFNHWREKKDPISEYQKSVYKKISELQNDFFELFSYLENLENLIQISKIYNLANINEKFNSPESQEEWVWQLFVSLNRKAEVSFGDELDFLKLPQVLSYFNTKERPKKIQIIGRPHSFTASSFHVKHLNQVFYVLAEKGCNIEIPATEMMYRAFWTNIAEQEANIEFLIPNYHDFDKFPNYLKAKNNISLHHLTLTQHIYSKLQEQICSQKDLIIPDWQYQLNCQNKPVSVTSFDQYVQCPLQFYYSKFLGLRDPYQDVLEVNPFSVGSRMHKIAEYFIERLVVIFGNKNENEQMLSIFENFHTILNNESLFLSQDAQIWKNHLKLTLKNISTDKQIHLESMINECVDLIWEKNSLKNNFEQACEQEVLKRGFKRLLWVEKQNIAANPNRMMAIEREKKIEFNLCGMNFTGKIDRIDASSEGYQIIDYKTSKIPKKKLFILPSEFKKNARLSVQGALYSYGYAQNYLIPQKEVSDDYSPQKVSQFSLYHLKSLAEDQDSLQDYKMLNGVYLKSELYLKIQEEYKIYVENFIQGNFTPKPLDQKITCQFCEFLEICPFSQIKPDSETDEEVESVE